MIELVAGLIATPIPPVINIMVISSAGYDVSAVMICDRMNILLAAIRKPSPTVHLVPRRSATFADEPAAIIRTIEVGRNKR